MSNQKLLKVIFYILVVGGAVWFFRFRGPDVPTNAKPPRTPPNMPAVSPHVAPVEIVPRNDAETNTVPQKVESPTDSKASSIDSPHGPPAGPGPSGTTAFVPGPPAGPTPNGRPGANAGPLSQLPAEDSGPPRRKGPNSK